MQKNVCLMVLNAWFFNRPLNHMIRSFENRTKKCPRILMLGFQVGFFDTQMQIPIPIAQRCLIPFFKVTVRTLNYPDFGCAHMNFQVKVVP